MIGKLIWLLDTALKQEHCGNHVRKKLLPRKIVNQFLFLKGFTGTSSFEDII